MESWGEAKERRSRTSEKEHEDVSQRQLEISMKEQSSASLKIRNLSLRSQRKGCDKCNEEDKEFRQNLKYEKNYPDD